jgi:outer membrane murein-binding lipoprotein Lpp
MGMRVFVWLQTVSDLATILVFMDKAKQKTIMDMTPQELIKSLTASIGEVTKAQINTALVPINAELRELKQDMQVLKQDVQVLKQDVKRIEQKLDKVAHDHEERIVSIEEHLGLPHKN